MASEVVNVIIQQLGGIGRLRAMVNARDFVAGENSLQFAFSGSRKVNKVRIEYRPGMDDYVFEIGKYSPSKFEWKSVAKVEGAYWEDLIPLCERSSGLCLSL